MENKVTKTVWTKMGERFYLSSPASQSDTIGNGVYKLKADDNGQFYVSKISNDFSFEYKIYGLETKLVDRVIKTYENTDSGNIGVLLNGLKGTGKTVSSKIICNRLNQPVIVVSSHMKNCHLFLNDIPQNVTIFIDEYEKIFGESADMLTIMDGALNSKYRRVFVLTTNKLYIDDNLIQRPGRIRYMKKFSDLSPDIVEEIIDDVLVYKHLKRDCIKFISSLEVITVDIVKAVLSEVNIHNESPENFKDVFNVKKMTGKYNVYLKNSSGASEQLFEDVEVYPRPNFDDDSKRSWFKINDVIIGDPIEIINYNTFKVNIAKKDDGEVLSPDWVKDGMIFRVEHTNSYHYNYTYGYDGMSEMYGSKSFKRKMEGQRNDSKLELSLESPSQSDDVFEPDTQG